MVTRSRSSLTNSFPLVHSPLRRRFPLSLSFSHPHPKSSLVGIIVPDFEVVTPWAKANGIDGDESEIVKSEDLKKIVMDDIAVKAKENKLRGFEFVRDIYIHHEAFTVENDLITPTFKLKRPQAKKAFQEQLDKMYEKLD